jgi:hypothetical protein
MIVCQLVSAIGPQQLGAKVLRQDHPVVPTGAHAVRRRGRAATNTFSA